MIDQPVQTHETASLYAHSATAHATHAADAIALPHHWPAQGDLITLCQHMSPGLAALLIGLGALYLVKGYDIYKALIVLNAGVLGASIGSTMGESMHAELPLAIVGGVAAAALSWPLMKWAVAVMGGLFGALVGASVWRMCDLNPEFIWAGATIGLVTLGMLSFIVFRISVMMFTSLQGALMLIIGLLSLLYQYHEIAPQVTENMTLKPFLLPLAIFIPAVVGLVYQHHNVTAGGPMPAGKSHKS